jgi:radical SAM superfamily enzyme YgiQ (UPF0313 family)
MKVLLINPKFPKSFWSLPESCAFMARKTLFPPLGLLTVAALLPQEWDFRLVDLNTRPLAPADWQWADLVMISGMMIQQEGVLSLIQEAKAQQKTVVVGGPYASSLSRKVMGAGADFLVRGEAENTIPLLLAALRDGQSGGVIEADGRPDLAASPVPRFDLLNFEDYLLLGVQTSRGCPFDCEFCDIVRLYGRKPRYKTPDQVMTELEVIYRLGWRGHIFFSDDNFIGNRDHARALLTRLIPWMQSRGEPFCFWTQASVNLGQDRETIDLLTAANFAQVFLGVETPEPEILRAVGKHQNLRNPLGQSLSTINANGLSMIASFVIGFDGERPGAGDRVCQFVEEVGIPVVILNLLHPLPHTRLWDRLEQEGRLLAPRTTGDFYDLELNYLPARPREDILAEFLGAIDRLYEPSRYLARAYRYYLAMRPTRAALARQAGKEPPPSRSTTPPPSGHRTNWNDCVAFFQLIWRQGIQPSHRGQFWRQFWGIYRRNPSRLTDYLLACGLGENLYAYREALLTRWRKTAPA